jgi:hypothetical protein
LHVWRITMYRSLEFYPLLDRMPLILNFPICEKTNGDSMGDYMQIAEAKIDRSDHVL